MDERECKFCFEKYPVPSMRRFCEERHLNSLGNIPKNMGWVGLSELRGFIGGELTSRIEKAVLGKVSWKDRKYPDGVRSRFVWKNPNLQDIPALILLGVPASLLEHIEQFEQRRALNSIVPQPKRWRRGRK